MVDPRGLEDVVEAHAAADTVARLTALKPGDRVRPKYARLVVGTVTSVGHTMARVDWDDGSYSSSIMLQNLERADG